LITFLDNLKTAHSDYDLWVSRQHPSALAASLLRRKVASSAAPANGHRALTPERQRSHVRSAEVKKLSSDMIHLIS